jgi:hypothetical protein
LLHQDRERCVNDSARHELGTLICRDGRCAYGKGQHGHHQFHLILLGWRFGSRDSAPRAKGAQVRGLAKLERVEEFVSVRDGEIIARLDESELIEFGAC